MPYLNDNNRPGLSGLRLLQDAKDAFAARLMLIRSARHQLDIQYYIWHSDLSGSLLLDEIAAAASRGVQVRFLLDDNGISGLDDRLAILDQHPNIEVRLFNPFPLRRFRAVNWLFAFNRLNARMHAKSLTADRGSTIVGGRNIGDEYFGAQSQVQFDDLDVLAFGPIAAEVEQIFEEHWLCHQARPIGAVVGAVSQRARRKAARDADEATKSVAAARYRQAIEALPLYEKLRSGSADLVWAPARAVATMPPPGAESEATTSNLADLMPRGLTISTCELIIISGYFVPTNSGCSELADLRRGGSRVRVLTNSFAATDVGLVHAGYAPCRHTLLKAGIELFEMPAPGDAPKIVGKFVRSGSARARRNSGKSLHAKVYIVDRKQLYIGSANFDPRSAHINTELGFFIESAALSERLADAFEQAARNSYRLALSQDGALVWTDERDEEPRAERTEPGTNIFTRTLIRLLSRLSIKQQL